MSIWRIAARQDGQRLDQALAAFMPELGLRGRRRLLASGQLLLNGHPGAAACRVRAGDRLELIVRPPLAEHGPDHVPATDASGARFLGRQGDYAFFFKPAGLHSVALAGSNVPSLEACLSGLLPVSSAALSSGSPPPSPCAPVLLQRLDRGTSGIICAALSARAGQDFRAAECAGHGEKLYAALLCGVLDRAHCVRLGLDTAQRRKSRLLPPQDDACRWTEFWPLHCWRGRGAAAVLEGLGCCAAGVEALTLAACRIRRGARHQIRAHAASLGLPLWGDSLYGGPAPASDAEKFFLHHGLLRFPGAVCAVLPAWPLPPEGHAALKKLFEL